MPSVMTAWFSHFEEYLKQVLGDEQYLRETLKVRSLKWSPYVKVLLEEPRLRQVPNRVHLQTVLTADVWREARNVAVHAPRTRIDEADSRSEIRQRVGNGAASAARLWSSSAVQMRHSAKEREDRCIGSAVKKAAGPGQPLVEVFCAIFAFRAVDNLVHEIEEATLTNATRDGAIPLRDNLKLRNTALAYP